MRIPLLGGGINSARSIAVHSEYSINLYAELNEPNDKSSLSLIGTPGLELFTTVTSNIYACRGFFTTGGDRFFAVVGNQLIEISTNGTKTIRGSLWQNSGIVKFAESVDVNDNSTHLMIVESGHGYIFSLRTNTFQEINQAIEDYLPGTHVVFKDGYFIQNAAGTNTFIYSGLYNGLTWNALDYYAAEGNADTVEALAKLNNDLWVFGSKSIEVWYSTGDSLNPFARNQSAFIDIGITAKFTIANMNNALFWLGSNAESNRIIYMATSYQPQRISTHSIEYMLSTISDVSDAIGFCYQQEGHFFYILSFQNGNKTICYDMTTGLWHERAYFNSISGFNERHRAICSTFWNNKIMVGDHANGNIYYFNLDKYTDNGNTIQRIRQSGHYHNERKRVFFHTLELDLQRGVGLIAGQGSNPKIMLQWSDDGGFNWSNENWTDAGIAGKIGTTYARAKWNRLGNSRDRVFRFTMTDPVKWVLIDAYADISIEA